MWSIAIHGGAGDLSTTLSDLEQRALRDGLAHAVKRGSDVLATGGTAIDAVEVAVRCLEDNPLFNAGVGAVCNEEGECELDASIMRGTDLACGAVGGMRTTNNPIRVARAVMEQTPHVLLVGAGADRFAAELGFPVVSPDDLVTERRRSQWERLRRRGTDTLARSEDTEALAYDDDDDDDDGSARGTVGAVALDSHGDLAAATSTGGLCNKRVGRVGDSGVIGAGTWAQNETCAVSATGNGEIFQRHLAAHTVHVRMALRGEVLETATSHVIDELLPKGAGGLIALDGAGRVAMPFSTRGMLRATADSTGNFRVYVDEPREDVPQQT